MYAVKEAIIAKEHVGDDCETTIFFMDMRTHGKDFEKYYNRAKENGVRFVRSKVHSITEIDDSGTVQLEFADESGRRTLEAYDLVVLSVGMEASTPATEMAKTLGVALNHYDFVQTSDIAPVSTSKPGIYVAGAMQGCKDIPQSVMEASAAACQAEVNLTAARNTLVTSVTLPEETDVGKEAPRIGVFVCNCGVNIGGFADVPAIAEYARSLPNVVYVEENLFTCAQDTQDKMVEVIKEHSLNRVVVAACTPRTHEPLFQETIRNAGLNAYLFEMANIRNQCTWVHSNDKKLATTKSKDLVRMAISRASLLDPIPELSVDVDRSALIIGGGVAGMTAALSLADQGFGATIVERSPELGGAAKDVSHTWQGEDVPAFVSDLVENVINHDKITVRLNTQVTSTSGFVGNFITEVTQSDATGEGQVGIVNHGVTIVATGGQATTTEEYLSGQNDRVLRWHEIEGKIDAFQGDENVVFVQCVGSRDDDRPYCSRICCTTAVAQSIRIKETHPDTNVYVLYRDIRTYAEREVLYKKARELGVIFIRYSLDRKPVVTTTADGLAVKVFDPILQQNLEISTDYISLATAIEPIDNSALASLFKLPLNTDNFLMEAHAKLRPVEFATDGVFLCGLAHYPKPMDESIAQAMAAASRAAAVLSKTSIQVSPLVSRVDVEKCIGCGLCAEVCAFGAIELEKVEGKGFRAKNIPASCKGCGLCAASCPQLAIDMLHFKDQQIRASVCAAMG